MRAAMEMMLIGDSISGEEAVALGWTNRAFPPDELEAAVVQVAERVVKIPTDIVQINKRVVHRGREAMGLRTAIRAGTELCALGTRQATLLEHTTAMRQGRLTDALRARDEPFGDYRTSPEGE